MEDKNQLMSIYIFKAEEIPDMDAFLGKEKKGTEASCNGFIEVKYKELSSSTKVVKMQNQLITWNEGINIPLTLPVDSDDILLTIKDSTPVKDDLVGTIKLSVNDIIKGKYEQMNYLSIYGSFENDSTKENNLMNTKPELGMRWKGRLLLKANAKSASGNLGTFPIEENLIQEANQIARKNPWSLIFNIQDISNLPDKEKMSLRIQWENSPSSSILINKGENHHAALNTGIKKTLISSMANKAEELSDVFIYLMHKDGGRVFAFKRIPASEIYKKTELINMKLIPEKNATLEGNKEGETTIALKIGIFNSTEDKWNEDDFKLPGDPKMCAGGDLEDMLEG